MGLVTLTIAAAICWRIAAGRIGDLATTHRLALNLAHVLAHQTEATVKSAELKLLSWKERLEASQDIAANFPTGPARPIGGGTLASLTVYNEAGSRIAGDGPGSPDTLDDSQVSFHRAHPEGMLFVSLAKVTPGQPNVSVLLSERLNTANGAFAGIVTATVNPTQLIDPVEAIDPGPGGYVSLTTDAGIVIARRPFLAGVEGGSFAKSDIFQRLLPKASNGPFETTSPADHVLRIGSYERAGATGLVVVVALSKAAVLADWRTETCYAVGALFGLLVLASLMGRSLAAQIAAQAEAYRKLAAAKRALRAATGELQEANRRLLMAEDIGHIGHWHIDAKRRYVQWSDEVYRIYGLERSAEHPLEQSINRYHPDDQPVVQKLVSRAIETGEGFTFEVRLIRSDGAVRDVYVTGRVEYADDGTIMGVFGIVQDITDRKNADREVVRLNRRITLANRAARVGIWESHLPTGVQIWDDEMYRLFGVERGKVTPSIAFFNAALHPDDYDRIQAARAMAISGKQLYETKFRIVLPGGAIRHIRTAAYLTHDQAGKPLRLTGGNWDVTETENLTQSLLDEQNRLREMAERWEAAKDAAENANRAKSDFLTSMSHELRTPMNGVLGFTQLLQAQHCGKLNETQLRYAAAVMSSGTHLLKLIDDVLDLSKVESGKLSISPEEVDLRPVMLAVTATLDSMASLLGVTIKGSDKTMTLPTILADRTRILQAVINLGSNAVKYNRRGGSVVFSYEVPEAGWVRIAVTDTGTGIPENRQAELFQPFNRLGAEARAIDGTGIGLSLTRRLVELMGGRIGFRSVAGEGSCFWIDMPEYVAVPRDVVRRPFAFYNSPEDATLALPNLCRPSGCSILYVEDNELNRILVREACNAWDGIQLIEAEDGETGWIKAQEHRPDVIILDIHLPDINGFALLQRLRRQPEFAETPIMALTANAMPSDVRDGIGAGFFHYATKPIDLDALFNVIERALESRRELEPSR